MPNIESKIPLRDVSRAYPRMTDLHRVAKRTPTARRYLAQPRTQPSGLLESGRDSKLWVYKELPAQPDGVDAGAHWRNVRAFMNRLRRDNVGVCLPVSTRTRQPTTSSTDGTRAMLVPYREHVPYQGSPEQVTNMATLLSQIHGTSARWRSAPKSLPAADTFKSNLMLLEISLDEMIEKGFIDNAVDTARWQTFVSQARARLMQLHTQALAAGYGSRHIGIHGDFHPGNVLFQETVANKKAAPYIIDFDCSRMDDPLDDVIRGVLHLDIFDFRTELPSLEKIQAGLARARAFVQTYRASIKEPNAWPGPIWEPLFECIVWQLVILYFLKGIAKPEESMHADKIVKTVVDHVGRPLMSQGAPMRTRKTARMLLLDANNRVLLEKIQNDKVGDPKQPRLRSFWITPGGKVEPGESHRQTLERELAEETGIRHARIGPCLGHGSVELNWYGMPMMLQETFYVVHSNVTDIDTSRMLAEERRVTKGHRWFSLDELKTLAEPVIPQGLANLMADVIAGRPQSAERVIDLSTPKSMPA